MEKGWKCKWIWRAAIGIVCVIAAAGVFLWQTTKPDAEGKTVYAGNYARGSDRNEEFRKYVTEHAVSKENVENNSEYSMEKEGSVIYTLDSEAVEKWGEPCNSNRFSLKRDDFTDRLMKKGYSLTKVSEDEKNTVEIQKYGAILTFFLKREHFRASDGVCVAVASDLINGDVLLINVYRENESDAEIAEVGADIFQIVSAACSRNKNQVSKDLKETEAKVIEIGDTWYVEENDCMAMIENKGNDKPEIYFVPIDTFRGAGYYWP